MNMLQYLDKNGHIKNPEGFKRLGLTADDIKKWYRWMLTLRIFGEHANRAATLAVDDSDPHNKLVPLYVSPRGQEAAQIASAYALGKDDWLFWYMRSHGGLLVKGIDLQLMWKIFMGILTPDDMQHLLTLGIMPYYIIVGGHLMHAVGKSWGNKLSGKTNAISMACFGDGTVATGSFHSTLNFSGIHKIPTILFCENNGIALSTPNELESATPIFKKALAYGITGERVDGRDPFAVYDAVKRHAANARLTGYPALIEAVVDRLDDHTSAMPAKTKAWEQKLAEAAQRDPLPRFKKFLQHEAQEYFGFTWTEEDDANLRDKVEAEVKLGAEIALEKRKGMSGAAVVAQEEVQAREEQTDELYRNLESISFAPPEIPDARGITALNFALHDIMQTDPRVIILGEDVAAVGSVFQQTSLPVKFVKKYLPEQIENLTSHCLPLLNIFGKNRVIDTPLDENGIVGSAIGLVLAGYRPIVEIQFGGFIWACMEQIVTQLSQLRHRSKYVLKLPIVIRVPYGGGPWLPHHREFEAPALANLPDLILMCPSTAQDWYDIMWAAIACDKPVIIFEDKNLHRDDILKDILLRRPPHVQIEEIGIRVARPGTDVTLVSYGRLVYQCLDMAEVLQKENISVEVLDMRRLAPLDQQTLIKSVQKTGRIMYMGEEPKEYGLGAEVISTAALSDTYDYLQARPARIGPERVNQPDPPFWKYYFPRNEEIIKKIRGLVKYEFIQK